MWDCTAGAGLVGSWNLPDRVWLGFDSFPGRREEGVAEPWDRVGVEDHYRELESPEQALDVVDVAAEWCNTRSVR